MADGLLVFECGECGQTLKAPPADAGRKVRCPTCGASSRVPIPTVETASDVEVPLEQILRVGSRSRPADERIPLDDDPPRGDASPLREYKVVGGRALIAGEGPPAAELESGLNALAAQGWTLHTLASVRNGPNGEKELLAVFERPA